ncbi:hypothetical protein HNO88_003043 [Novosphingobium chloroacetimidivorans]|uniref:DUF3298 domain-containing protein n=1 Tax=Novosphingobium chloroacetimidivorans TaxID=1428314 RepID=A0A7W7NXQ6_9SPHN|nr:hypothetical protein [Novosphingobium chloroacetimidivorans]MBB4859714.1 hypothetical protein [Novosphingobium chloroacetimidivorans]
MHRLLPFCLAGLACTGAPVAAAEQAAPYPTAQVLGAARDACSDLSSREAAAARIAASGWSKAADPYATPVGELVRFGYEAGRKMLENGSGTVDSGPLVFSRQVAGESLNLVLSSVVMDGVSVMGCRTYDVGETRRIGKDAASAWAGREPDQSVDQAELVKYTWEPGLQPGQDSFEVFYVPAGSPLIAMVKFPGIAIKADQVSVLPR